MSYTIVDMVQEGLGCFRTEYQNQRLEELELRHSRMCGVYKTGAVDDGLAHVTIRVAMARAAEHYELEIARRQVEELERKKNQQTELLQSKIEVEKDEEKLKRFRGRRTKGSVQKI